jgi:hypothetical protein
MALSNKQLEKRISLLETKAKGIQNNANNAATNSLPKAGGSMSGNLIVEGALQWSGEATGDFQGTWNGKSISGAQLQFLDNMVMMSATNQATGTLANVVSQFNTLLGKLVSCGYMN